MPDAPVILVEDSDAHDEPDGPAALVLPVQFAGTDIGRLAFGRRQEPDAQGEEVVRIIARELGGPIRMATLVEEAQRLATIDALTGLMNRRAFLQSLEIEMERATRLHYPLSLILLDVDHFKAVNDSRGHAAGDMVLSGLGRLLAREARKSDLLARWGGEEFIIVLSGADVDGGKIAAERYRAAIEKFEVRDASGERIPVTASMGLASMEPAEHADSFVDRADRAMYAAKTAGRNQVAVAPGRILQFQKSVG
jgi:two-component system cell cycle response regulator